MLWIDHTREVVGSSPISPIRPWHCLAMSGFTSKFADSEVGKDAAWVFFLSPPTEVVLLVICSYLTFGKFWWFRMGKNLPILPGYCSIQSRAVPGFPDIESF